MHKRYASCVRQVLDYLREHAAPRNILFVRPSGKPIAVWIVVSTIGECFTLDSFKRSFGKSPIYSLDFAKLDEV